ISEEIFPRLLKLVHAYKTSEHEIMKLNLWYITQFEIKFTIFIIQLCYFSMKVYIILALIVISSVLSTIDGNQRFKRGPPAHVCRRLCARPHGHPTSCHCGLNMNAWRFKRSLDGTGNQDAETQVLGG
ncbi:unnamed protein product, partial [Owenia fusiformis]